MDECIEALQLFVDSVETGVEGINKALELCELSCLVSDKANKLSNRQFTE